MNALVKDFYLIYLKLLGAFIVFGIVITIAIKSLGGDSAPPTPVTLNQSQTLQTATAQSTGFIKVANTATEPAPAAEPEEVSPEQSADDEQLAAPDNTTDDKTTPTPTTKKTILAAAIEQYAAKLGPIVYLIIFGVFLMYFLVIFLIIAYMKARITNLVFNNTSIDHIGFFANQRMRDLVWLYFSNVLILIFTAGLGTPWAHIRMARYHAERLALTGETDWDKFVGEKKESSRAMGEEIADIFNIDISFG
jgi:hypothetical protein